MTKTNANIFALDHNSHRAVSRDGSQKNRRPSSNDIISKNTKKFKQTKTLQNNSIIGYEQFLNFHDAGLNRTNPSNLKNENTATGKSSKISHKGSRKDPSGSPGIIVKDNYLWPHKDVSPIDRKEKSISYMVIENEIKNYNLETKKKDNTERNFFKIRRKAGVANEKPSSSKHAEKTAGVNKTFSLFDTETNSGSQTQPSTLKPGQKLQSLGKGPVPEPKVESKPGTPILHGSNLTFDQAKAQFGIFYNERDFSVDTSKYFPPKSPAPTPL